VRPHSRTKAQPPTIVVSRLERGGGSRVACGEQAAGTSLFMGPWPLPVVDCLNLLANLPLAANFRRCQFPVPQASKGVKQAENVSRVIHRSVDFRGSLSTPSIWSDSTGLRVLPTVTRLPGTGSCFGARLENKNRLWAEPLRPVTRISSSRKFPLVIGPNFEARSFAGPPPDR
jgi:hypothetical protein